MKLVARCIIVMMAVATCRADVTFKVNNCEKSAKRFVYGDNDIVDFGFYDFNQVGLKTSSEKVKKVYWNPLLQAVHYSFAEHHSLKLTPDHIWLTICQGISLHINASPEKYRSLLVNHGGKKKLEIRRDDFERKSEVSEESQFPGTKTTFFPLSLKGFSKLFVSITPVKSPARTTKSTFSFSAFSASFFVTEESPSKSLAARILNLF